MVTESHGENDYADQIGRRWEELHPGSNSAALVASIRLERVGKRHDAGLDGALLPFAHRGVRNVEDFRLLAMLRRTAAPVSATEVSREMQITKAATSTRVERLVDAGLVERESAQYDRRSSPLVLTSRGTTLTDECLDAIIAARQMTFANLSESEVATFADLLKKAEE